MSKFKVNDHVRVITPGVHFDKVGRVIGINAELKYQVDVAFNDGEQMPYQETELTLADPDVHTVLDQMDAESAPSKSRCRCFEPPSAEVAKSPDPEPDPVNRPAHYTSHPSGIECIEITRHMGFNTGNAFKYIWRADLKGNAIQDLEKAAFYIRDEIAKRKAAQ